MLLVEDNELNRFVAIELLGEVAGMDVTLAGNGHEALGRLRDAHFDLVLMDIQMPGMDGLQATRPIRADPALAGLPVIAMTAHAFARDREQSRAAGMNDHVSKPFEPAQLFEVMLRWPRPVVGHAAASAPAATASAGPIVDSSSGCGAAWAGPSCTRRSSDATSTARRATLAGAAGAPGRIAGASRHPRDRVHANGGVPRAGGRLTHRYRADTAAFWLN